MPRSLQIDVDVIKRIVDLKISRKIKNSHYVRDGKKEQTRVR